jgi:diaminopimelate decarboxylase
MLITEIAPESASMYSRPSVSQILIASPRSPVLYARRTSWGAATAWSSRLSCSPFPSPEMVNGLHLSPDRGNTVNRRTSGLIMFSRVDSHLRRADDGELMVEGARLSDLVDRYGTPLHVMSESRLRENYRRIRDAFMARWDRGVEICYAIKANPALAIRRVLADEGAHGDCLGLPELRASLIAGTPGHTLVLNGNNKAEEAIRAAVRCGARINVDDSSEPARIRTIAAEEGQCARVGIRTKPDPAPLADRLTGLAPGTVGSYVARSKWGLDPVRTASAAAAILTMDELELVGLHCHLGRHFPDPELFGGLADSLGGTLSLLASEAGWHPEVVTFGGGFTQGRDPYSRKPPDGGAWPRVDDCFAPEIELYADALCTRLAEALDRAALPAPRLGLEPGRYIAGPAGVTVTRVGVVKRSSNRVWVQVDTGITHIGVSRCPTDAHAVTPVRTRGRAEEVVDVVGPLCVLDLIADQAPLERVQDGELLAILDTGAYADGEASNANSIGRPAVVLVCGEQADLIRRRETFADVFGRDEIPARLVGEGARAPGSQNTATLVSGGHA